MSEQFDHEKLDVYQLELEFLRWATVLLDELTGTGKRLGEILDQLDRASLSILLNTAEGNGKRQRRIRARFFDDSRGSATECAACLDGLVAKRACTSERIVAGKQYLVRIVSMLSKLVARFESSEALREDAPEYHARLTASSEEENEGDDEDDRVRRP
ncbi:four helix bundle protein [bacterium]|nr:four helix bundle protein [bacterium]